MSLDNISYCRYLTDISEDWTSEQWRVWNIVQAVKGYECKGYAVLSIDGVRKRLNSANRQVAIDWFVDRVINETTFSNGVYYLCPIPDSNSTPSSTHETRTMLLATNLSQRIPRLKIWPHLKFKKPMQKRVRNEQLLFDNMICTKSMPNGYIILLDDVCTTGAHARAAQRRLVSVGAGPMCAMSVARTMLSPDEEVFGFRSDPL